jgi:hypothetical protein
MLCNSYNKHIVQRNDNIGNGGGSISFATHTSSHPGLPYDLTGKEMWGLSDNHTSDPAFLNSKLDARLETPSARRGIKYVP